MGRPQRTLTRQRFLRRGALLPFVNKKHLLSGKSGPRQYRTHSQSRRKRFNPARARIRMRLNLILQDHEPDENVAVNGAQWGGPALWRNASRLRLSDFGALQPSQYSALWLILAATFTSGCSWLMATRVAIDTASVWAAAKPVTFIFMAAMVLRGLGRRSTLPALQKAAAVAEDLFFSASQALAIGIVSGLLIYLAARAGAVFPLRDGALAYADSLLGFDWDAVSRWLAAYPVVSSLLRQTYLTSMAQGGAVLLLGSVMRPGERNGEFLWTVAAGVALTAAIFAFVPAAGKIGYWTTDFLDRLLEIRGGTSGLSYTRTASLVSFPSFHTVAAVLVTYAARRHWWSLIPMALLNAVMLASISPVGGHYLIDIVGGAAVACAAISVGRFVSGLAERQVAAARRPRGAALSVRPSGLPNMSSACVAPGVLQAGYP